MRKKVLNKLENPFLKNIEDKEYRIVFNEIDLEEFKTYFNKVAWNKDRNHF